MNAVGTITARSLGTTTINATCGGVSVACRVTVVRTPVTGISLTNTNLLMRVGRTAEIAAIVRPIDATDNRVEWTSSDTSIATVDEMGIITAVAIGNAVITATSVSDPDVKAVCNVTVETDVVAVRNILITESSMQLLVGESKTLTATIIPEDATDPTVTWRSSDTSIATVDRNGTVTGISEGEAIIYASSSNGLTAECRVTVTAISTEPTGISLTNTQLLMLEGSTANLIAIVHPDNADNKTVTWATENREIATVDANGKVTAVKVGETIITASTYNGKQALCHVTVVPEIIAVSGITLNKSTLELNIDETFTLIATITPDNATDKTVTWISSNNDVATVSADGTVTGVSEGNATIYASTSSGLTAICEVTVNSPDIDVVSVELNNRELLMPEGSSALLIAIVNPANATDKRVVWTSSNNSVATVDATGRVNAIKEGTAFITATSISNSSAKDVCKVTVMKETDLIAVTAISLNKTKLDMTVGDTEKLIATITPDDATDKTVSWKSSNSNVATVDQDGNVIAVSEGTAIVYATASNGMTAECEVTVKPDIIEVESISLSNTELLMTEGDTAELIAIVYPDNAADKTLTWSSDHEDIATVDQNGIVTAIKVGITTITVSSANGKKAYCSVTVVPGVIPVTDIILSDYDLHLIEGDIYTLTATILPENATDKNVTWRSADRAIATVDNNGTVTAISKGITTIYASSSNGLTAECTLTVEPRIIEVTSITLNPSQIKMMVGEVENITAIITPEDATDQSVGWTSANEKIATVVNGSVIGQSEGETIITATTSNGKSATCHVTVYNRPLTPRQLLRKGDGTTSTFIVLMDMTNDELEEAGYKFVYGFTDTNLETSVMDKTHLRYAHTTPEIFNDPDYDFWVYAILENEDGMILNSNLRHLDGREEVCYDISRYSGSTKSTGAEELESDEWIKLTPSEIRVFTDQFDETRITVYSLNGTIVYSDVFNGDDHNIDTIGFNRFSAGTYILKASSGNSVATRKFVVR